MFFKIHKEIQYEIFGQEFPMTDLTKTSINVNKGTSHLQHVNVDARTPEQLADDIYNDPKLYWVILYINNIVDPFSDWYMMEDHLYNYCIRKYGSEENMMKVKYFKNRNTDEVITGDEAKQYHIMVDNSQLLPEHIDYYNYYMDEQLRNEGRKVIKVVPPALITKFVDDFKKLINGLCICPQLFSGNFSIVTNLSI